MTARIAIGVRTFLKPARISRSVTVVLALALLQSIAGPILLPKLSTSSASAANACVLGTDYTKDTSSLPGYTILKFTNAGSCSFRNTEAITTIDYLIVGGGGGGGAHVGGGGGGGGVLQASNYNISGKGAIPITVGAGGTGAWVTTSWQSYGSNGGNSSLNGVVAYGGGVGGIWNTNAPGYLSGSVGSAGGAGYAYDYTGGTPGQGRAGGWGNGTQPHAAGGGGGAGEAGGNGTQTDNSNGVGGKGGDGISVNITGTPTYFGGGGGGGVHGNNNNSVYTGGAGGLGGGAAGASHSGSYTSDPRPATHNAASGTANTGGGGGGDGAGLYWVESRGGNGGSGIVIIRYANSAVAPSSQDFAMTTSGTNYMYTTNSTSIIPGTVSTMTLEAWIKPSSTCDGNYLCMIFTVEYSYLFTLYQGKLAYYIGSGTAWCDASAGKYPTTTTVKSGEWSHVALVRNGANVKIYVNGQLRSNINSSCSPATQAANSNYLYVGARSGNDQYFYGSIDEARIWNTDRSANIASDMNSNETSTSGLLNYWNFNEGTGLITYNQVPNAPSENDLVVTNVATWDSSVISTTTTDRVYTVQTFYRSYITALGGWKVPSGVSNVSALIVGGGGGGGWNSGGGGGGGGFLAINMTTISGVVTAKVGMGGMGALSTDAGQVPTYAPAAGQSSQFGGTSVTGGNPGGVFAVTNAGGAAITTASNSSGAGGAGAATSGGTAGIGGTGPTSDLSGTSTIYSSGGGGGGYNSAGGAAGAGAGAGGGSTTQNTGVDALPNRGGGGGASAAHVFSGNGGSGIIIVRWITATKPTYTKPVTAYLNAGMTETFTTNVTQDSATAVLTRTFKWESTTPTANGTYTLIKQGTGAANASFSWVPTDTSTSGSGYLYRLTVTDSDAAGLNITDSSTAFAVINRALVVSGSNSFGKAISLAKSETYTISFGTSTYRASMSPTISGITLDTSTAGSAVLKISDTISVGTYYETLTVIDSVSASVVFPIIIKVQAPPQLTNTGEIITDGQVFNLDFSNSASYSPVSQTFADISGAKKTITAPNGGKYSNDFSGIFTLSSGSSHYLTATAFSMLPKWTIETYIRINDTPTAQFCPFASEYASSSISMLLCIDAARTVFTGFFDRVGGVDKWSFKRSEEKIPLNTWVHIVGTFDGSAANLYFDGVSTTRNSSDGGRYDAGYIPPTPNTNRVFIGKDYPTAVGTTPNISLGFVRAYSSGFTQIQVQQNFNATKTRFESSNQTQIKPTKKYGTLVLDSFTATSGYDTKTVTLAVGDRAGIDWDTTTATNQVRFSIQESLTVGTYNDTLTVTDSLGQSSYLPITFTVTKADTITVTMGTEHTTVYTGTAPAGSPRASISGLVGVDTATIDTQYSGTYIDSSLTCAQGGSCSIGDIGPGGGRIFYISSTPINAASGVSNGGIYLEAAPRNWNGDGSGEAGSSFASVLTNVNGTSSAIGTGAENSRILRQELGDSATAATKALNRSFNGVDDWFVPSYDELTRMITVLKPLGLGSFDNPVNLWSSTQNTNTSKGNNAWSSNPPVLNELLKTDNYFLRPIRAFSPTYNSTVTPTEVDTYTAKGTNLTFQVGAASNYQAVIYDTSTLKITQANQKQLTLNLYGAVAGTPFTLQISGGSGTGAVTETVTAGSTAVNCRVSNKVLSNDTPSTEQKTCNISITKASSRNYKAETLTATVYFMMFVNNQPTNQVGGGTVIALNGVTSFETSTVTPPGITGFSSLNISLSAGGTLRITGSGLTGSITVKFSRNKTVSATAADGTYIDIPVASIQSAGASSGRVAVVTVNGEAVSDQSLTITP
ncbi:Concanavalin A-like lectin/glucanases superfamily [Candidatus Nanopelagicaceae bacterium]